MTVPSSTSTVTYTTDGISTIYPVPFRFLEASHILVTTRAGTGPEVVEVGTYTVAGAGNPSGGTVTFSPVKPAGITVVISRNVPLTQEADYVDNDPFPAESHEDALDKLTMIAQQLKEQGDRSLRLPITAAGVSTELPFPVASNILGWDASLGGIRNFTQAEIATAVAFTNWRYDRFTAAPGQTAFTLSADPGAIGNLDVSINGVTQVPIDDYTLAGTTITLTRAIAGGERVLARYGTAAGATDASVMTWQPAGAGAVQRTVQSKLREVVSPEDFGAVGDGITDDQPALKRASDYLLSLPAGGCISLAAGRRYAVGSTWAIAKTPDKRVKIEGNGATLMNLPSHDGVILRYGAPSESISGFPLEISGVTFRGQSANATAIALEWAGTSHIQDCLFFNLRQGVFTTNGFALRFTGCQFLSCSVGGIVSSTIGHNMMIDRCGFFVNTRDVYFIGAAYNFSAFQSDFEGGQHAFVFEAGGAAITIDSCYIEGKSGNQIVLGAATSSIMERGCWHGYNSGTQDWSNALNGVIEGNIFWNQTVTMGTAIDLDIGANTWAGTSVAVYPPWTNATLQNSFTNSGAPYHNASFRKGRDGCVYLRGAVTGPADNIAFILPAGYRPASNMSFLCPAAGGGTSAARVNISSDGNVTVFRAPDSSAMLDNIRFIAGA